MALRPPQNLNGSARFETADSALQAELLAERAQTLGRLGRELSEAMARLAAAPEADRAALTDAAAERAWRFFVQRETCGLHDQAAVIADYGIPRAVLARIGAVRRGGG